MTPRAPASAPQRRLISKHAKPPQCGGCPLETLGRGFVPPDGPERAPIFIMGETPWTDEVIKGFPFAGAAGAMVERVFRRNGWTRSSYRFGNVLQCAPPHLEFTHEPWLRGAIDHCRQYTDPMLAEPHAVVVPVGNLAIRRTLNLWGKKIRVEDFHGTVTRDPLDRHWVVLTFHPSYLQRGAVNLIGVVSFDFRRAHEVAQHGWEKDPLALVVDPPFSWFEAWATQYLAAVAQHPHDIWLAIDIETDEKAGKDEASIGPLTPEQLADKAAVTRSYKITRVNFACHPDEGLTVPCVEPYLSVIKQICASPGTKLFWFGDYDWPRLEAIGCHIQGTVWDLPWGCHLLQSDVPLGLGFWAPIYSRYGGWKHLSEEQPGDYAAVDGAQTLRIGYGAIEDLLQEGMWYAFQRHVHDLKVRVLQPAHVVGVKIDRERLEAFEQELTQKASRIQATIQDHVPDSLRPLVPKQGLKARPISTLHTYARTITAQGDREKKHAPDALKMELFRHAEVVEKLVIRRILSCEACGAKEIQKRHRCKDKTLTPQLVDSPATVTRFFWKEPFNPSSWQQLLAYMTHYGHTPGRAKGTGKDSTDRETLQRLARTTKDVLYQQTINLRAVTKVRSTYVLATKKRLDQHNRIHPVPTFRPSTQRLSYIEPNITNVITDRGGKESLAAGFRTCVVAEPDAHILEVDFGGIEAVLTGWFARDPAYVRLARLGVHAGLASHVLKRPFDPAWDDATLAAYFQEIKASEEVIYDRSKRTCHGNAYGLTEWGMVRNFPETFPDLKTARKYRDIFFTMAPEVPKWQDAVRAYTDQHGFIGGSGPSPYDDVKAQLNVLELDAPGEAPFGSPFGYKHWFWSVYAYSRITLAQYLNSRAKHERKGQIPPVTEIHGIHWRIGLGEDAKRCLPEDSQVWMGDYSYKAISDVKVGDTVIGWERGLSPHAQRLRLRPDTQGPRQFLTDTLTRATVQAVHRFQDKTLTLHLASGRSLRCTADHFWLGMRRHEYQYLQADQLVVGDKIARVDVTDPGECPAHLREAAAWLAGFYDGEGHYRGVSQSTGTAGHLLEKAEQAFQDLGFRTARRLQHEKRQGRKGDQIFLEWLGKRQEALHFARWIPSTRYREQWADEMILSARFRWQDEVVAIEQNSCIEPVVCLTTTTGNFIADGACSHNCIAFLPQSTAAGILKEKMLALFADPDHESYIGDAFHGQTPLRAPIHDSLLLEVPTDQWHRVLEAVCREMLRPIPQIPLPTEWGMGEYLSIGIEAKAAHAGGSWADVQRIEIPSAGELGVAGDRVYFPAEEHEAEDDQDLGVVA